MRPAGLLRVLTWNIHGGVGVDGIRDYFRAIRCIAALDPDIVALQEIDERNWEELETVADAFKHQLGFHGIFATSIETETGNYGQLLLSRWPFRASEIHDISAAGREPRRMIAASIQAKSHQLRIVATHLGLKTGERRRQAHRLAEFISQSDCPTVLMGDFNDWNRFQGKQGLLERLLPAYTRHRTFPSRAPVFALDRIYCHPRALLQSSRVVKGASLISDHLPLVAELAV